MGNNDKQDDKKTTQEIRDAHYHEDGVDFAGNAPEGADTPAQEAE